MFPETIIACSRFDCSLVLNSNWSHDHHSRETWHQEILTANGITCLRDIIYSLRVNQVDLKVDMAQNAISIEVLRGGDSNILWWGQKVYQTPRCRRRHGRGLG
jgi:hypothetical protein